MITTKYLFERSDNMKKTLAFLLILIIAITSLTGCNIPNDNTPNNKKIMLLLQKAKSQKSHQ